MDIGGHASRTAQMIARAALKGGVTILQLRDKDAPLPVLLEEGRKIRELCRQYHVPFIVNDRVDVALLLDADGVHVGQEDIPGSAARKLLGDQKIVGISASSMEEAEIAIREGADYIGVGPIYATATKPDAGEPVGVGLIRQIRRAWSVPIVGIGGINADNAAAVIQAGAEGVAVVSAITRQDDPEKAAERLRSTVEAAKR
jgi:thiamine-phosphate pyrophosphorylase